MGQVTHKFAYLAHFFVRRVFPTASRTVRATDLGEEHNPSQGEPATLAASRPNLKCVQDIVE
jgi:hypothetical protein